MDILGLCLSLFIVYYKGIFYFVLEKFILLGFIFFSFLIVELHVYENELYKLVGTFCYYNIGYLERCKGIVGHMNLTEKYFLLCFPFHIQFSCVSNFRSCCHHTFLECGHTRMEITNLSGWESVCNLLFHYVIVLFLKYLLQ